MKAIIVGLGIQGQKRKNNLNQNEYVASVDPYNLSADFKDIKDVRLQSYDTVFICTPDQLKYKIIVFCLNNNKNFLVEKPFPIISKKKIINIQNEANKKKIIAYTAYNHRFEPHFNRLKKIINSRLLGKLYYIRIFYGNGTSMLVRQNKWKDSGLGVISDLGSHLFDLCDYLFNRKFKISRIVMKNSFENKSSDHAIIFCNIKNVKINLEMTTCMWRNSLRLDLLGKKGSAHIDSLCKWGKTTLFLRKRKFPSGKPKEKKISLLKKDPTWKKEINYFRKLIRNRSKNNLQKDAWISDLISKIS
jgi:predicted dehydrogenase